MIIPKVYVFLFSNYPGNTFFEKVSIVKNIFLSRGSCFGFGCMEEKSEFLLRYLAFINCIQILFGNIVWLS